MMPRLAAILPAVLLLIIARDVAARDRPVVIRVDPAGMDVSTGLLPPPTRPVRTLEDALVLAGSIRASAPDADVTIALPAGVDRLADTVVVRADQGGDAAHPLVIRGAPGGRTVLSGSRSVTPLPGPWPADLARRLPESARGHARLYRLPPSGLANRAVLGASTLDQRPEAAEIEVYDAMGALVPARWPNQGWATLAAQPRGNEPGLAAPAERLAAWRGEPDLWAEGYWFHQWSFESVPVARVDAASGRVAIDRSMAQDTMLPQVRARIVNALGELDAPGEWWMDRARGLLVAWPRDPVGRLEIGTTRTLLQFASASHIRLEDVTLEHALGDAVLVHDGEDVVLRRVQVAWVGGRGIVFDHAHHGGVEDSRIAATGGTGVSLTGGDRASLAAGGLFLRRSRLSAFGRLLLTQRAGVEIDGVGAVIEDDRFSEAGTLAVWLRGNDHRVVGNTFANLLAGADDGGAIYAGRDWTARGTLIARNVLRDIRADPGLEVKGIYLDDFASGFTIRDNLFLRVDQPVFIGGGRDNVVTRNVFVASSPAVHVDSRGETWAAEAARDPASELRRRYAAMPVSSPQWRRYAGIGAILADEPQVAKNNRIERNAFALSRPFDFSDGGHAERQTIADNAGPEGLRLASGGDLAALARSAQGAAAFSTLIDAEGRRVGLDLRPSRPGPAVP